MGAWIAFGFLWLATVITAVVLYSRPKAFDAVMLLEFKGFDQASTTLAMLTSDKVIERVVRERELSKKFKMEDSPELRTKVRSMVRVELIEGTDLAQVMVRDMDGQRAVDITRGIIDACRVLKEEEIGEEHRKSMGDFEAQIKAREACLEEARLKMETMLEEFQDEGHEMPGGLGAPRSKHDSDKRCLIAYHARMASAWVSKANLYQIQMDALWQINTLGLWGEKGLFQTAAMLCARHPVIRQYYPGFRDLSLMEKMTGKSGDGENHILQRAIRGEIDRLEEILLRQVDQVRDAVSKSNSQAKAEATREIELLREQLDLASAWAEANETHAACLRACSQYLQAFDGLKEFRIEALKEKIGGCGFGRTASIIEWDGPIVVVDSPMRILRPFFWALMATSAGYGFWCWWRFRRGSNQPLPHLKA